MYRPIRLNTLIPVLTGLLIAACSGDGVASTQSPATEPPIEIPTTYVIIDTVIHAGPVDGGGRISFEVRETQDSTRETLAGGQVVVYDYEMVDLEVTMDLADECAGADDPATVGLPGPFPVDADGRVEILDDELRLEGVLHRTASGLVRIDLVIDGERCVIGPRSWAANPTS